MPVTLEIMEKRSIGPTLGADSLEKSLKAGLIGLIAILIFMIGYYRLPGTIAAFSLALYGLLVVTAMVLLGSVWTLPGIAGFVLSIGMAVDANIIIYERIKKNCDWEKPGCQHRIRFFRIYCHSDPNITTLITAGVLMYFGTGPIKGFAVTLSIGIIMSMLVVLTFTLYVSAFLQI